MSEIDCSDIWYSAINYDFHFSEANCVCVCVTIYYIYSALKPETTSRNDYVLIS